MPIISFIFKASESTSQINNHDCGVMKNTILKNFYIQNNTSDNPILIRFNRPQFLNKNQLVLDDGIINHFDILNDNVFTPANIESQQNPYESNTTNITIDLIEVVENAGVLSTQPYLTHDLIYLSFFYEN